MKKRVAKKIINSGLWYTNVQMDDAYRTYNKKALRWYKKFVKAGNEAVASLDHVSKSLDTVRLAVMSMRRHQDAYIVNGRRVQKMKPIIIMGACHEIQQAR